MTVLNSPDFYYEDLLKLYTGKRDYMLKGLDRIGLKHNMSQGTYFVLVDISEFLQLPQFVGYTDLELYIIKLPEWEYGAEECIIRKKGCGELSAKEWNRYLPLQKKVTDNFVRMCAWEWSELEAEEEILSENRQGYINPNFELLLDYVDNHFREDLTLSFLAEEFYLNISYICVLFKKLKKDTFSGYLNSVRMKEARKLLLTKTETTAVIAEMVGYKDYYYFNKVFKKQFGMTPRQCRIKGGANEKENKI